MTFALRPSGSDGMGENLARGSAGTLSFQLEPLSDIGALAGWWRAFDRHGSHSFFLSWPWIGALASSGNAFSVVMALRGSRPVALALAASRWGLLAGLCPVRQLWLNATGDRRLDGVMLEHNGFAVPGAADCTLWPSFLSWFAHTRTGADELIVPGLVCGSAPSWPLLIKETRARAYRAPLAGRGMDDILRLMSRNTRQKLRRDLRAAGAEPAIDVATDEATAQAFFSALKALHIQSWTRRAKHHAFSNPAFEPFHRKVVAAGAASGAVQLMRIRIGGGVLGYLYNFVRNGVVCNYQSGFETGDIALRPGYLCHLAAMAHYARQGMTCYDFLAGTNQLKVSLGRDLYEMAWRHYRKPGLAAQADGVIRKIIIRSTGLEI